MCSIKVKRIMAVMGLCIISINFSRAQSTSAQKPRLVVGIVVDQMRAEQLYRYQNKYSEDGFKRLIREGYNFKNTQYNYKPTVTAAGHATIFTGTTPSMHGMVGNSWYDRNTKQYTASVEDTTVVTVGSKKKNTTGASPKQLKTTTISDQLRLSTNLRSKVISVSLKDRAAVLPGGHLANAAYWYDTDSSPGYFVSSAYYMGKTPKWVRKFNSLEKSNSYLDTIWNPHYPIEEYIESVADNNKYEVVLGEKGPTFPYNFKELREKYRKRNIEYLMVTISPAGNTILTEFAIEAIEKENLGVDADIDMLTISYSVTDKAGHIFGPNSIEIADIYARLDRDIGKLLTYLDTKVGKGAYTVFLTSDHGAIPVASYLHDLRLPTGVARIKRYNTALNSYLNDKYGAANWIENFDGDQVYLDRDVILKKGMVLGEIQQEVANFLVDLEGIHSAITAQRLQTNQYVEGLKKRIQNGYYQKRSGDVIVTFDPGFVQDDDSEKSVAEIKGTIHGSGYGYDTHVPLLWFGNGVRHGASVREVSPTDIAATLTMMLELQLPSGNTGTPLKELFQE